MKRLLLVISIIAFLFCFCSRVQAQSNQTVVNGAATATVTFPATGCIYNWVNNTPSIGLAASGTGNILPFTALNTGNSPVTATITATPATAEYAYISNEGSNDVKVINTATNAVVAIVSVGLLPIGVAVSPDGNYVYIVNNVSNSVSVISTASNTVVATVPVGTNPVGIAVSPDGGHLYVANNTSNNVTVINTSTYTVETTIPTNEGPVDAAFSPDGKKLYLSSNVASTVTVINTANNSIITTIPVGVAPSQVVVSPDGATVYVENFVSNTVSFINAATNQVVSNTNVGTNPWGMAMSPDGKRLYVSNQGSNNVSVINTTTKALVTTIPVGINPYGVSVSLDGSRVYVANINANTISIINTATNTVTTTIPENQSPAAFGAFITKGPSCAPFSFTITVNPSATQPTIIASTAAGYISACVGSPATSPNIQQFTFSGSNISTKITATAPPGFEMSFSPNGNYSNSLSLAQIGGDVVENTVVYVRSLASDPVGTISGNIVLTSAGAANQSVAVKGVVNALPTVNTVANQTVLSGTPTTAINFTGSGNSFKWINDTPSIGLAASGGGNIPSFTAVNTTGSNVTATITVTPVPQGFAYIANSGSNTVSVVNTVTNAIVATIPVGKTPFGVSLSPDGSKVYVTNENSNTVSIINTLSNTVVATIAAGNTPYGVLVSPDGNELYITNENSNTITVISTATNAIIATIPVGSKPEGLAFSPDGSQLYVANNGSNNISVINTNTNTVFTTVATGVGPAGIAVKPDGSIIYVTNNGANSVTIINAAEDIVAGDVLVGIAPFGIVISPDGSRIYTANIGAGNVSVVDGTDNQLLYNITTLGAPTALSLSSDGGQLYITDQRNGFLYRYNTANLSDVSTVTVGSNPISLGNFVTSGANCIGTPTTFTITVKPSSAKITAGPVTGTIMGCVGTASANPHILQFPVSGVDLSANVTASAPAGFEVSLNANSGYGNSVTLSPSGGTLASTIVYVRSASTAQVGSIGGNVILMSAGIPDQDIAVTGMVNALPTVNQPSSQTVFTGSPTTVVNFTGTGNTFSWTNDSPGIDLAANGIGNIASFNAVNSGNSPITATITVIAEDAGFAYIANFNDGTVSVINTLTNAVVSTITVGKGPYGVTVIPDGSLVYVANTADNTVSVINTSTNAVTATIKVGAYPLVIATSTDGSNVYVTNTHDNTVSVINVSIMRVTATLNVGSGPGGIAFIPGDILYVANASSNTVSVINTTTNALASTINVGADPHGLTASPDGSKVYVTNYNSNTVSVINTSTNLVAATIPVGSAPEGISISADGSRIYVANDRSNTVSVINAATNTAIATVNVGTAPYGISVSADGSLVYVANSGSNTVSIINTATNTVSATVNVGGQPIAEGNFIKAGSGCTSAPTTFTITVKPLAAPSAMIASVATGDLSACVGSPSATPEIQRFTVSGVSLTGDITATAPPNFEVSLTAGSGYGSSVTIAQTGGTVNNTMVYVRSEATDPVGLISGNVILSSPGLANINVAVKGIINALPTVDAVGPQSVLSGNATTAVNFTGTANTFTWTNDTPGIGLPASGSGNIASFTAVNKGSTPITATITVTPFDAGFAYIATAADIKVINTTTNTIVATINSAGTPSGETVSADGKWVYVSNQNANLVSVVSTITNTVVKTIPVQTRPYGIVVSPDGSRVYVANFMSNTISVINTGTYKVIATIPVGLNTQSLAMSPDGSKLYAANGGAETVTVINTANNTILTTIPFGSDTFPVGLAMDPDGKSLYVTDNNLEVINTANNFVTTILSANANPYGICISPDGGTVYAANNAAGSIEVVNVTTNTLVATIPVGVQPRGLSITNDGRFVYVTNYVAGTVSVINTATNTVIATIPVGKYADSLGNFVEGGTGCSGPSITFTITVNPILPATITDAGDLSPLTTVYGTPSASISFTVSGTAITSGILVTPPPGFEVSTDNIKFSSTVIVTATGTVAATPVYIRLAASTPVGSYSGNIVLSSDNANSVNEMMPVSTVTPAPLTITADNKTKPYGAVNPPLTVSYSGFVNKDKAAQLSTLPTVSTTATTTSPIGQYPVTASGADSPNYTFTYIPGILSINPAGLIIPNTFTPNGDGINDTWDIKYIEFYPACTVNIFNRYGQKLYSSIGYPVPWDGKYNGAILPSGTYYYIIDPKNGLSVMSGWVAIIR